MYILFDVGGTRTRLAISSDLKTFEEPVIFNTPAEFDEGISLLINRAKELVGSEDVLGIAGGVPGSLNDDRGKIIGAGNLTGWIDGPIVERLLEAFKVKAYLANDAELVGLGEAHFGAAAGYNDVVYLTVSTGFGGGRIIKGRIDESASGFEPGSQVIDADRTLCPECRSGKLEDMISGRAMQYRFGKSAKEIPSDDDVWGDVAKWLAAGVYNVFSHWSPDVIVLGGPMIVGDPAIPLDVVTSEVAEILKTTNPSFVPPPIKKAELDDLGGLFGAMILIGQKDS